MASYTFTDSHCHLDFSAFDSTREQLLSQCCQQGIKRIIVPAVSPKNWQATLTLARSFNKNAPQLLPCLGIHPWYLQGLTFQDIDNLIHIARKNQSTIVAIGETGIDGKIAKEQYNLAKQIEFFRQHIYLANQLNLPLIVHHRSSHSLVYAELKKTPANNGGIIHAFSGSYQQACQYIDLGFKLGIGGTISYERAKKTINTLKKLPLSSLVLETDAPSMPLSGFQGTANSPLKINTIFELLCQYRQEKPAEIAQTIEGNIDHFLKRVEEQQR